MCSVVTRDATRVITETMTAIMATPSGIVNQSDMACSLLMPAEWQGVGRVSLALRKMRGDNYICRLATIRSAASGQPAGLCQPVINGHGCAGSAHEADTYGWQDPGGRGGRQ